MKFLLEPRDGTWVAMNEQLRNKDGEWPDLSTAISNLRERVYSAQKWFMDLDDNHTPSPAKVIAKRAIGTSHFDLAYVQWAAGTAWALAIQGKASESTRWQAYVDSFLRTPKALEEVKKQFKPESLTFYPGVVQWCRLVTDCNARLYYVSRNIAEVVLNYTTALDIQSNGIIDMWYHGEVFNKAEFVKQHSFRHPLPSYYHPTFGVDGDSAEDGDMIDVIRQHRVPVVGIQSMNSPRDHLDPRFDYAVSKDRRGLVKLLQS